ncbi:hypothetical protein [Tissierella sp.]|uniref:hypothetical protein n=1 Tax=Tissierella sp. TaxID=41274 RepID=UPI00303B42DB
MEKSSFFNSINGDRKYKAEEFAAYFASFISNGIFPNPSTNLQVLSNNDMTITIKKGKAWINGYFYENTDDLILGIDNADGVLNRIDRVVVRLDKINREIKTIVKKGTFTSSPVVPELTRNADVYELGIAEIKVNKGAVSIVQLDITDTRLKLDVCGVTNSLITVDVEIITNQFSQDFNNWFDMIKDQLGEDAAGRLQNQIGNINDPTLPAELKGKALTEQTKYVLANAGKVKSVNNKTGDVVLSSSDVGAVPTSRTVNGKALNANIFLTSADVGAVPTSRMVNGKVLSSDISLEMADIYNTIKNSSKVLKGTSVCLGTNATVASNTNATAIGAETVASSNAVALGYNTTANTSAIAIGFNPSANGINSIAIGESSRGAGRDSIAIGSLAKAEGERSIALGGYSSSNNEAECFLGDASYYNKWKVPGSFTVSGTKNFEISHPHPDKKATHMLRHAAVESPTAGDTLYRYNVKATKDNNLIKIDLPDYFIHLNKDVQIFVTPQGHFGNGYGVLNRETEQLEIHCQYEGEYNVLVIGTRNDDHQSVQDWDIKGVEREIGESWTGETYAFEVDEIIEVEEIKEVA